MKLTIYTDGGSRGNPGPAAAGVVITDAAGNDLFAGGFYLGRATNNVAEYTGMVRALQQAQRLGGTELTIFCDSDLMVKQLNGQYRVKNATLKELYLQCRRLIEHFSSVTIEHVYRHHNKDADAMVNQALDAEADVAHAADLSEDGKGAIDADRNLFADTDDDAERTLLDACDLRKKARFDHHQPQRILLGRRDGLLSGLICLSAGQHHTAQTSYSQATATVMRGSGEVTIGAEKRAIHAGSWLHLAAGEPLTFQADLDQQLVIVLTAVE